MIQAIKGSNKFKLSNSPTNEALKTDEELKFSRHCIIFQGKNFKQKQKLQGDVFEFWDLYF